MSTRATYLFEPDPQSGFPRVCFYIHHDGYPEGAAAYLLAAMTYEGHGRLAERFLRANDQAEFTRGHEAHGDTEFRYTLRGEQLQAEKRFQFGPTWNGVFYGTLAEFVKRYAGACLIQFRGRYLTTAQAEKQRALLLTELGRLQANHQTGNASHTANEVWLLTRLMADAFGADEATAHADLVVGAADREHVLAYGWAKQCSIDDEAAYQRWVKTFRTWPKPDA